MNVLELDDTPARTWAVVFDAGDEPIEGLTQWAAEAGVDGAHLTAIGAFRSASIGWFDPAARDYRVNEVDEQVEVVSMVGDITAPAAGDSSPKVHVHVVLAGPDGHALGGHLVRATVRPTLEVVVEETSRALRRRHDPATGLALLDLGSPARESASPALAGGSHGQDRR
jgi:hypothetical protein